MMHATRHNEKNQCASLSQESVRRNILLADSEEHHRAMLAWLLREEGHDVTFCGSLLEALKLFEKGKFDFVISDYSPSGIDGLCLLKAIKQRDEKTPVLLISSQYEWEPYLIAMNLGALDYLSKPLNYSQILRLVKLITD